MPLELLAAGRMAEVFAWGDGRVLKLDRPEWNGCAALEADVLARVVAAGVAAPRVHETVTVDERLGLVLDRIDGPLLADALTESSDVDALAHTWNEMHGELNAHAVDGLPDLMTSVIAGIEGSGLDPVLVAALVARAVELDDGRRQLCHFDLHPKNVIVGANGWVVIDWLTASAGPPAADFARTLLLAPPSGRDPRGRFMTAVMNEGITAREIDRETLDAWVRVLAAARLSEGFDGEYGAFLAHVASGARNLDTEW